MYSASLTMRVVTFIHNLLDWLTTYPGCAFAAIGPHGPEWAHFLAHQPSIVVVEVRPRSGKRDEDNDISSMQVPQRGPRNDCTTQRPLSLSRLAATAIFPPMLPNRFHEVSMARNHHEVHSTVLVEDNDAWLWELREEFCEDVVRLWNK